jgi:hypothetical protein
MTTNAPADLRYPIGRFKAVMPVTHELRGAAIDAIEGFPSRIREAVIDLNDGQLDTPYRPEGWTVRQVVHHVADSHMNGLIRVKLALTEDTPTIKPYDENAWSTLPDMTLPIAVSLSLIEGIHTRWIAVVNGMAVDQFSRSFIHPELKTEITLDHHLQLYAWHSHHHLAHITELRRREGW